MKNFKFLLKSFQAKVTIALICAMLFSAAMTNFLVYKSAVDLQLNQLRNRLMIVAQMASLMVNADMLMEIPLNREGANTLQYKIILGKLKKVLEVSKPVRDIYIMRKTEHEGIWQFVVDPVYPTKADAEKGLSNYPGDIYNASNFPEMMKGFDGPSADTRIVVDQWGATLSGYAPVRDKTGKAVAIIGVDTSAPDVYAIQKEIQVRAMLVLALGVMLSFILGMLISGRITNPVQKLVEGTRHIAKGDLRYQVEVRGSDEIAELTESFNRMTNHLYKSRKQLDEYFYHTLQSFVLIMEARDPYTKGHSERVADLAVRIATRMNFSKDEIKLLRETALIHDIGKMGIQENVLNKKEKLTQEEWEMIKRHPVIGEDIVKPVFLNKEMLAIIRGHHERYDGSGYPDKLSDGNISVFTQILSVADTYDAMTSDRAYRPALSKQKAIEELRHGSGTQLSPRIVDVALQVIQEES